MKRRTIKGIIAAICIIQALNTSCEVGLGSAVDTQAPGITIERPAVDLVIRDKFVMSGEWNDDGVIDSVYVIIKRTDENPVNHKGKDGAAQEEIRIDGSFEKDPLEKEKGTWKAEVDPFDEANPIPDGKYQATIYIKDKGNHTTSQNTTFTVDNTPPVLILTKPASKPGDSTISKYGKRLFLEGKVADTTKETWIEIKFYNKADCSEESLLSTMQTQLIAPTDVNSNNAKLASFSEDLGDELAREYFDIYKDENGGDKNGKEGASTVYAALTVYDTAETCKEESGENTEAEVSGNGKVRGNSTGTFYFSKELSSSITKSKESGGYGLAPTDIYNILNGNYEMKDSSRATEAQKVTDELKELRKDREGERDITVFTINPENSPYFTVSGLKTLSDLSMAVSDNGYFLINGAMTLEISVFMGSDSIEIDSDSEDFYAYLLESDEYGEPLENAQQIKLYSKARESGSGKNKKTYYEIGGKEELLSTTGAYVFSVPMAKTVRVDPDKTGNDGIVATGIEYGKNYVIRVSGKDMEDNPIEVYDTGYGFHFTSGGGAPELEIEEPHEGTLFIKKGEGVTFSGRAKTEEGVAEVSVWNGETKLTDLEMETRKEGKFNRFSGRVEAESFDQEEGGIYTLTVKAAAGGDNEGATEYQRTIWYDVEEPKASNIKVSEKKEGEEAYKDSYTDGQNYFVNNQKKIISISGIATDNVGLESAVLKVSGEGGKEIEKTETENPGKWSFEGIDLRDWSGDEAEAELILEDKSGNKSSTKLLIKFDVTAPSADHKIDDSQKNLEFRIGDAPNDAGEADVGGKYSNGSYGSALTMQLRGNFPDNAGGSGINKFYYKTFNNQEVKIDSSITGSDPVVGTGENEGKIFFKDDAALIAYVVANKTDVFSPIAIETKNVEYNIGPYEPETWVTVPATSVRFGGSATTTENASGQYKSNKKGYVQFRTSVSTNFKTTMKGFVEGKNYLVIVAQDNAGNLGLDTATVAGVEYPCYSLNVDITAPSIPTKQSGTVYTNLSGNAPVTITGTVSDKSSAEEGSSGLKKIVFTSDQTNATVTVSSSDFTDVDASENPNNDSTLKRWTADIRSLLNSDGTAIISAKVSDNAGYETSTPVANVMVDSTAPAVIINSPAANAKTGTTVNISGTVNDGTGSGIDSTKPMVLYYTKNTTVGQNGLAVEDISGLGTDASAGWIKFGEFTPGSNGIWNYELDASNITTDGDNNVRFFTVSATDKAGSGNTGIAEAVRITVDRKAPVNSEFKVDEKEGSSLGSDTTVWFKNTTVNINGKFTDTLGSGVSAIKYQVKKGTAEYGTAQNVASDGSFSFNVKDLIDGINKIKVWSADAAGNTSTEDEYTVMVDSKTPVITTNYTGVIPANESACIINLTVTDDGSSGINKVQLKIGDNTVDCDLIDASTGAYSKDVMDILPQGTVSVTAIATDNAGNSTTSVIANVMLDTEGPVVTITSPSANAKIGATVTVTGTADDRTGAGVDTTKNLILYYTTDETTGNVTTAPASITTSDDASAGWKAYNTTQILEEDGQNWSCTVDVTTLGTLFPEDADTPVWFTVMATDKSGNGNKGYAIPRKAIVDRIKPAFDDSNSGVSGTKGVTAVSGKWFDATTLNIFGKFEDTTTGSGVKTIWYKLGSANAVSLATTDGTYDTNVKDFAAGTNTLKLWAVDAAGNTSDEITYTVKVDTVAPELTESGIGTTGKTTKDGFSLSGKAWDANQLSRIEIKVGNKTWVSGTDSNVTLTAATEEPASSNWTATFVTGSTNSTEANYIADGAKELTVTVYDVADLSKQVTRTVVVDTQKPVIGTVSVSEEGGVTIDGNIWYKTTSVPVTVPVTDAGLSGVSKVEYATQSGNSATWTPLSYDGENYTGTVNFTGDGNQILRLKATDVAGNVSDEEDDEVYIDTSAPELTALYYKKGTEEAQAVSSPVYLNSGTEITVYGNYKDEQSGVNALTFKMGEDEVTPTVTYSATAIGNSAPSDTGYTITSITGNETVIKSWKAVYTTDESGKLTAEGTNRTNTKTAVNIFEITIDDTAPAVSNVRLTEVKTGVANKDAYKRGDSYYVNSTGKTFTVSGIATDDIGVDSVSLSIEGTETITPTRSGTLGQWTYSSIDLSSWTGTASATVTVKDKAGNETTENFDIVFDSEAPEQNTIKIQNQSENLTTRWYNSNSLSLSGSYNDSLSGVARVYYKTGSSGEEKSLTPVYNETSHTYEYSTTIDFTGINGAKTLYIKAEDNAGNMIAEYSPYSLNIDTIPSQITAGDTVKFTNRQGTISVSGTVNDADSGIEKLEIKTGSTILDNTSVTITVTDTGTDTNAGSGRQNSWSAEIQGSAFPVTGTSTVYAIATDNAGNQTEIQIASITTDTKGPALKINSPAANAKVGTGFTVSGTAEDGNGAGVNEEVPMVLYYTVNEDEGTAATAPSSITEAETASAGWKKYTGSAPVLIDSEWTCVIDASGLVEEGANLTAYFTVSAADKSGTGNTGYAIPRKITVDNAKPVYDTSYTDLSIGGKTQTQMASVPWFKDDTLVVKGKFKDEGGSGVTKIFYQVDSNPVVELPTTDGTYNTNISGFGADSTLKFWAEDAAGNNTSGNPVSYTVKVDKTSPEAASDITGIKYSNKSTAFPVSLTVSDGNTGSGIASVVLSRDGTETTVSCTLDSTDNKYKATDIRDLLPASGNATVMATATDNAGNKTMIVAANILVDTTEPGVTLTAPADADTSTGAAGTQVNGTISLGGTASDENVISRVVGLLYKNADTAAKPAKQTDLSVTDALTSWTVPEGWTKVSATLSNANATTNWTFNGVDTTKLDGTNTIDEDSSIWFTVAVQDAAGNIGYSAPVQVYAKQDSDRPVITLSQLTKNTYTGTQLDAASVTTLKTKNVYGSVTDDDGTLEKLWYWNGATAPTTAPGYSTAWTVPDGWHEITINGGSWSIDSTEDDGQTTWYFAAADANKKVFAMVGTDTLTLPYIKYYGETEKVSGTAKGVTFKYDTNPPTATALYLYRASAGTAITAYAISADTSIAWSQAQNLAFGKDYDVLYAKVVVNESTGMKALTPAVAATASTPAIEMSSPVSISYTNLEFSQIKEVAGEEDEAGTYTYYLGPVTMNTTEQHEFKVTVEDAVGNKGYISRNIVVDNTEPTSITEVKPKATVETAGVFTYRGNVSDNTGGSGVTKVEWYLPKSSETDAEANTITWTQASLSAGWEIDFSGTNNLSTKIGYETQGTTSTVNTNYQAYETSNGSGVYNIPVWFKITDAVGNVGYNKENKIRYNPNTDRPSVQITSPVHNKTASISGNSIDYAIMGGSAARISGNAEDDEGLEAIYLQFDLDDDGKWDNGVSGLTADMSALPGESATLITGCPWTKAAIEEIKYSNGTGTGYFGIKVSGTKNWSYTLDLSSTDLLHITETRTGEEPNVTYSYSGNTIKVRAIAVDNDTENGQLVSAPSAVVNISVNNDIPLFSNLKLKQIDASNNVLSEDDYTDGKYLTGNNWYITGDVYAYGGISSANYTTVSDAKGCFTEKAGSTFTFDMKIPINPDASGKWDSTITVFDSNESGYQPNQQRIIIHIDNDPPSFEDTYTGTDITTYGTAKHYQNSYGARGTLLTPTVKIQDTNGLSSLWGKVTDRGSGFDKAVFYFKRFDENGTDNPRIYNPMEQTSNRTDIESTASVGKVYINDDGLPALVVETDTTAKMTVTRPENSNDRTIQVTLGDGAAVSGVAGNKNVRKGGLIKIGGKYRTITDVDYTSGIVTFDPPCDRSFDTAEIIYAMVVDSTGETMTNNTINEEDGDGMQENFSDVSGTVTWNAAIKTSYISDGPIELHLVVIDVAGNLNHAYTKTGISNNPLRLTKVMLGTDLNADDEFDIAKEYESFYAITSSRGEHDLSQGLEAWDLDTRPDETSQYFTVKKDLSVIPEFVGGTGDIYYKFQKGTANLTQAQTLTASEVNTHKLASTTVTAEGSGNKIKQFSLTSDTIGYGTDDADEDKMHVFSFSFWDSTESYTPGLNSSWAVLNAKIYQDLKDNIAPTGHITPFYWNSKTQNSIVWNGSGSSATALGHIELEGDLPADTFTTSTTSEGTTTVTTGEYDRDPKVSGQIYIEGTAFDETRLDCITVTFADKSVIANYAPGSGWSQAANGYGTITVTDNGPAQSGHNVTWKWLVNTTEVVTNKVADTDKIITVSVKDANPNTSETSSTQTTVVTKTPYYKVDIVPYVTSFTTTLSSFQSGNPSVYDRTALGHYPVYMTHAQGNGAYTYETVTVNGFNLNNMSITFDEGNASATLTQDAGNTYSFTLPTGAKSGKVTIGNATVSTLNNKNNNNACGSVLDAEADNYAGCYNRQPNGTNNNLLTDDLVIDVWDFNSKAAIAENNGKLNNVIMKISPTSGMLGFAFSNGSTKFSMGGQRRIKNNNTITEYSYYEWDMDYDYLGYTTFAYDSQGHAYGGTAGGDTNSSNNFDRYGIMTDRINASTNLQNKDHKNTKRTLNIEGIGQYGNVSNPTASTVYMRKDRIQSSCFATLRNGKTGENAGTYIYLAYYDALNDEIRFKAGEMLDSTTGNVDVITAFGNIVETEKANYQTAAQRCQILATNTPSTNETYGVQKTLGNAGNAVAIGVTSGNVVVMVWYDSVNNALKYSYNDAFAEYVSDTTPTKSFNDKVKEDGTNNTAKRVGASRVGWSDAQTLISGAGEYCQLVVDANNGIHVVAYDSTGCDLKYAYLPSYDGSVTSCTVDSYLDTGSHLSLDVAAEVIGNETYYIPHIGYWAAYPEKAHYAYIAKPAEFFAENSQNLDGTADDKYTGIWECGVVPSRETVREGKINVGLWKKDINITSTNPETQEVTVTGTIKGQRVASNYTGFSTAISEANGTWGKCYGNGTDNAVLAYVIAENSSTYYIETAQMR